MVVSNRHKPYSRLRIRCEESGILIPNSAEGSPSPTAIGRELPLAVQVRSGNDSYAAQRIRIWIDDAGPDEITDQRAAVSSCIFVDRGEQKWAVRLEQRSIVGSIRTGNLQKVITGRISTHGDRVSAGGTDGMG
jgi:hypothetical protein